MDIRPVAGRAAHGLPDPAATPPPRSSVESPEQSDHVEISDLAREAHNVTRWADAVRSMPDIRESIVARVARGLGARELCGVLTDSVVAAELRAHGML